ncbi:AAA family ATPase [Mesorhizobium sp. M0185]|uniref:AAA family ATPase n=1 Tax=unclassified Mesorhizobium TaxID=325217 RepID=UPI00333B04D7
MRNDSNRFFVLTGGPGPGKTTLIEALKVAGLATSGEAGRSIITTNWAIGAKPALAALFAELMLSWELRSYRIAGEQSGLVFFDRGVPDTLGYLRLTGVPVPDHATNAARRFRYARRVFVAPPWPEIFRQDNERKQTMDEAERTFHALVAVYTELGYELVPLPLAPVETRLRFVLSETAS